jgi:glycosyltransferase involved in cell wall biosynthesis
LVSVLVPTRNSARYLERCLRSIRDQTYLPIEIIVSDNESEDLTEAIARSYADVFLVGGSERSAQVNAAAKVARGEFIFRVDSDFELEPDVVRECVTLATSGYDAVIVHNSPDTSADLLARIRKFEVDMYKFSYDHSAARFMPRHVFLELGGFREDLTAGEDYDLQNRIAKANFRVGFCTSEALHLDEPRRLLTLLKKYYLYGRDFPNYRSYNQAESRRQLAFFRRDYFRCWRSFIRHPFLGVEFLCYHILKYAAGAAGYWVAILSASWLGSLTRCKRLDEAARPHTGSKEGPPV